MVQICTKIFYKEVTIMSNEKKFNLKKVFTMWLKESQKQTVYLSGVSATGVNLIGFVNGKKENPKEPDIEIYVQGRQGEKERVKYCNLWVNVSESGIKYISGKVGNERLVGFFNEGSEVGSKKPYFTVYFSVDKKVEAEQQVGPEALQDGITSASASTSKVPF